MRLFHAAGYRVVGVESLRWHKPRLSRAVSKSYCLPWPRLFPDQYVDELVKIIEAERIELVVPTYEETFYVARARDRLSRLCAVFCDDIDVLDRLHNKYE